MTREYSGRIFTSRISFSNEMEGSKGYRRKKGKYIFYFHESLNKWRLFSCQRKEREKIIASTICILLQISYTLCSVHRLYGEKRDIEPNLRLEKQERKQKNPPPSTIWLSFDFEVLLCRKIQKIAAADISPLTFHRLSNK